MSSVINRTTYVYKISVNTPDYSDVIWLHNPDLSGVSEVAQKYWKVVDDTVVEMDQTEKDAVDAAEAAAAQAALDAQIVNNQIVPDSKAGSDDIFDYLEDNTVWTDGITGIKGPPSIIQMLANRREIFGDTDNPLSPSGYAGALINRATNFETIHGKLGWHEQEVLQSLYKRPKDLLIYYGYLNSFNSGTHGWNNEKVAQEMAQYSVLVFGDGVQNPTHPDYANSTTIIARVKALNPNAKIFGYVTVDQDFSVFKTKVGQWKTLAVHGIFLDEAGYDFGKTRAEFNLRVTHVHAQSMLCFANAWNTDNILGTTNDVSYPNTTYNSGVVESKLTSNDWVLLESFPINTTAYTASTPDGYETKADWATRGAKAASLRAVYGVNFAASGIINNANSDGQDMFDFLFVSALQFSLDAVGSSDTSYASSSAAVTWWTRSDITNMGVLYSLNPSVQVDIGDSNIYWRYVQCGKLKLDFSSSLQDSVILKW